MSIQGKIPMTKAADRPRREAPPGSFRCDLCGGIFPMGDEGEALAEAAANGFDPAECGVEAGDMTDGR